MKTLQNNFTTPEQSKILLELGVPADSADCYYNIIPDRNSELMIRQTLDCELKSNFFTTYNEGDLIPCWSVGRLMEIVDICSVNQDYVGKFGFETDQSYIQNLIYLIIGMLHTKDLDFSKLED